MITDDDVRRMIEILDEADVPQTERFIHYQEWVYIDGKGQVFQCVDLMDPSTWVKVEEEEI